MNKNCYDIIIIGAGIAGLYSAYNIKKYAPEKTFLILEKNKKHLLGGRAVDENFHGSEVATGAGIGRKRSDYLLIDLMKDLEFKYSEFKTIVDYSKTIKPVDIMKLIDSLKVSYKKHPELRNKTFKEFFIKMFNEKLYKDFVLSTGYTDYENADTYETLYNYTMKDIIAGWTGLYISWTGLSNTLYKKIGREHFKFSNDVLNIKKVNNKHLFEKVNNEYLFEIATNNKQSYYSNKVIIATTIAGILKLVPNASSSGSLYKQIHNQPFIRVYAKFNKESSEIIKSLISHYTILKEPLQKIIPINSEKGIYMIAYSDNQSALYLKKYTLNTSSNREVFCRLLEEALSMKTKLKITSIRSYYWDEGTHYYEPLYGNFKNREDFIYQAQHPQEGMVVVGEVVSIHQGWVEGALESVHNTITKKWIRS
jgi:hypothetical protein